METSKGDLVEDLGKTVKDALDGKPASVVIDVVNDVVDLKKEGWLDWIWRRCVLCRSDTALPDILEQGNKRKKTSRSNKKRRKAGPSRKGETSKGDTPEESDSSE